MDVSRIPAALRDRLGSDGTGSLVEVLSEVAKEWTAEVIGIVGDRFERRLVEETSALRVEMAQGQAALRIEMAEGFAALRQEMAQGRAEGRQERLENVSSLRQDIAQGRAEGRQEMAQGQAALRVEMAAGFAALRQEMAQLRQEMIQALADQRVELLRWAFLFWVGQFFAVASVMIVLARLLAPGG